MTATPEHRCVRVDLGSRAYDILVGHKLLDSLGEILDRYKISRPWVVLADAALRSSSEHLLTRAGFAPPDILWVQGGESAKSLPHYGELLRQLAQRQVPRSGTIVALGGGVLGDLAGFIASTYRRGLNLVQVPTTLLAMVDSSVGGKTGLNLAEGKNLIGTFHQPLLVLADLARLHTLPPREFAAGLAEVIKAGLVRSAALFERLERGVTASQGDLASLIAQCIAIKARLVEADEYETNGLRALLNFGHTLGHAIEQAGRYEIYRHGEAIALGLRAAAWLSVAQTGLPDRDAQRIEATLAAHQLPVELNPAITWPDVRAALGHDKKNRAGTNRWVLLREIGESVSGVEIAPARVEQAFARLREPIGPP